MRTLFISFFLFCSFSVNAQYFVKSIYDTLGMYLSSSGFIQNSDSSYNVFAANSGYGLVSMRFDNSGNMMWVKTISISGMHWDGYISVDTISDSAYIIVGTSYQVPYIYDVSMVKFNRLGQPLWVRSIGSSAGREQGRSVKHSNDGGFIVSGATLNSGGGKCYLLKTDSVGDVLWSKSFYLAGGGWTTDVLETSTAFFTTGLAEYGGGYPFTFLMKTDKLGNTLMTKRYDSAFGTSTSLIKSGDYFLLAANGVNYSGDISFMKVDTFGSPIWCRQYHFATHAFVEKLIKSVDGGYLLSGTIQDNPSTDNRKASCFLIKTDSIGSVLWCKRYGERYPNCGGIHTIQALSGDITVLTGYFTTQVISLFFKTDSLGNGSGICEELYNPTETSLSVNESSLAITENFNNDSSFSYSFSVATNAVIAVDSCIIGTEGITNITRLGIKLFPNPSTGIITIESPTSKYEVEIFNFLGVRVYTQTVDRNTALIDLTTFPRGNYLCSINVSGNNNRQQVFVLQ